MKIRDSIYNAGNDYPQWVLSYGGSPVPPGPVPPGPVPPGPGPSPAFDVTVSISVDGRNLVITASGDTEHLSEYKVNVYEGTSLVKTYDVRPGDAFALDTLDDDLPAGDYTIRTYAVSDTGEKSEISDGINYTVEPEPGIILGTTVDGTVRPLAAGDKIIKF